MDQLNSRLDAVKQYSHKKPSSPVPGSSFQARMQSDEANFKDFIKDNLKRPQVSPEFIQSIKEKIRLA